jgi:hypothetical protein
VAAQQAAATHLAAAGFSGTAKQAVRLAKLLDLENVEPDDNGVFDLEDEVDELVQEYPSLFQGAPRGDPRRKLPAVRRTPNRSGGAAETASDRTSRRLLESAGFTVNRSTRR